MAEYPTNDEVLAAVEKAGWLLEQQAVRILEAAEFSPRPGWAFQDPDKPESSRELDVWAYRQFLHDERNKIIVSATVLVECKQSASPFCAVGRDLPEWRQQGNPTEHTLLANEVRTKIGENTSRVEPAWDKLGFRELATAHGFSNFRADQLTRLDRPKGKWEASSAEIFTSLVFPLAKAIRATQSRYHNSQNRRTYKGERVGFLYLNLVFPVVLISSPLYVVDAGKDAPLVSKASWVRTQRDIKSASVQGLFEFDVVTIGEFAKYLTDLIVPFCTAAATHVAEDPSRFTGESQET